MGGPGRGPFRPARMARTYRGTCSVAPTLIASRVWDRTCRLIIINVANRTSRGMSGSSILGGLDTVITLAWHNPGLIGAVNMSLGMARNSGGVCRSWIWDLASRLLRDAGVAVAAASGNDSKSNRAAPVGFPAMYRGLHQRRRSNEDGAGSRLFEQRSDA